MPIIFSLSHWKPFFGPEIFLFSCERERLCSILALGQELRQAIKTMGNQGGGKGMH